jgi:hypothetical protein
VRYFFDTNDGTRTIRDDVGVDLACLADVRSTARDLLFDLGHAEVLNGRERVFIATVRDEQGAEIYCASMTLRVDVPHGSIR